MRRRVAVTVVMLLGVLFGAEPAWAAPSTQVVRGEVLTLVSVADWDAAASLLPGGEAVQWDVVVSADAPDPGTVTIGLSASGDAPLIVDAALCMRPWTSTGCPGGASQLRSDWRVPLDGAEVRLAHMADTETAHLRLSIALAADDEGGRTDVRVQAAGVGEVAGVGPGGGVLAATGMSQSVFWILGGGAALVAVGVVLALVRSRRSRDDGDDS